jgi:hypothetical protein
VSYIIKRIGTDPIVVLRFYGEYDGDHSTTINRILDSMFEGETRTIWRVFDATDFQMPFAALGATLSYEITHTRWTIRDPRVKTVAVINEEYGWLGIRVLSKLSPGLVVPLLPTLKDALQYTRAQVDALPVSAGRY